MRYKYAFRAECIQFGRLCSSLQPCGKEHRGGRLTTARPSWWRCCLYARTRIQNVCESVWHRTTAVGLLRGTSTVYDTFCTSTRTRYRCIRKKRMGRGPVRWQWLRSACWCDFNFSILYRPPCDLLLFPRTACVFVRIHIKPLYKLLLIASVPGCGRRAAVPDCCTYTST